MRTVDELFEHCFAILIQKRLEVEGQYAQGLRVVRQEQEETDHSPKTKESA